MANFSIDLLGYKWVAGIPTIVDSTYGSVTIPAAQAGAGLFRVGDQIYLQSVSQGVGDIFESAGILRTITIVNGATLTYTPAPTPSSWNIQCSIVKQNASSAVYPPNPGRWSSDNNTASAASVALQNDAAKAGP